MNDPNMLLSCFREKMHACLPPSLGLVRPLLMPPSAAAVVPSVRPVGWRKVKAEWTPERCGGAADYRETTCTRPRFFAPRQAPKAQGKNWPLRRNSKKWLQDIENHINQCVCETSTQEHTTIGHTVSRIKIHQKYRQKCVHSCIRGGYTGRRSPRAARIGVDIDERAGHRAPRLRRAR